jgi:hypothetical protein
VPDSYTRDEFLREVEDEGESCFASGRQNNISDLTLSIVAILGSLIATVLAAASVPRWAVAAVAAVPAACASLQRIVDFRGRSVWYFKCATYMRSISYALKYSEAPNLEEFARKRGEFEAEMEREWSRIGREGATPSSRKRGRAAT